MYEKIKQKVLQIIPQRFLHKNERFIRWVIFQFFRGSNRACNICGKKFSRFILLLNGERLCPNCGSAARNRRLWQILNAEFIKEGFEILHFSPARCLYRKLKMFPFIRYHSSDHTGKFLADKQYDITSIDKQDESYHLIICYHVLEHIADDSKAMSEMYRVLKQDGSCLIQSPFLQGNSFENNTKTNPEELNKQVTKKDLVRIYSLKDIKSKLEKTGFKVEIREFSEDKGNYLGMDVNEHIIIARKTHNKYNL